MTLRALINATLRALLACAVGEIIAWHLAMQFLDYVLCEVLSLGGPGCAMRDPSTTQLTALRASFDAFLVHWQWGLALLLFAVLLPQPGRYLVRERGVLFDTLLGACFSILFALWLAYGASTWRFDSPDHPFHALSPPAFDAWCLVHEVTCQALGVPMVLLFLSYLTLLPALLAEALMRVGRVLIRSFKRLAWPVG
jgi:hypothetical protein